MDVIAKCAACALSGSVVCLLIKKFNPELSAAVSIAFTVAILSASILLMSSVKELVNCVVDMLGISKMFIRPMLKCLGIGFIGKHAADLCRDASQGAVASALEFCAVLSAASVAMPTLISMLKMIGTMI